MATFLLIVLLAILFGDVGYGLQINITVLDNATTQGADFYNWNRVWVNYCDGSSFTGDVEHVDPESAKNLPQACTSTMEPSSCFFPENIIPYIETPLFIINSAYDAWQISNTLVPSNLDSQHAWEYCRDRISNCTSSQIINIQEFLNILKGLTPCYTRGYFITSCHTHARIVWGDYWFDATSPRILNKTIAEAIGDWYFDRTTFHQHIDPYPGARYCKRST
uniref:Pectin acetylesterase n=1 Tax=Solanum tuberosum TaxID=4113 RepID=M1CUC8_SOLTU